MSGSCLRRLSIHLTITHCSTPFCVCVEGKWAEKEKNRLRLRAAHLNFTPFLQTIRLAHYFYSALVRNETDVHMGDVFRWRRRKHLLPLWLVKI